MYGYDDTGGLGAGQADACDGGGAEYGRAVDASPSVPPEAPPMMAPVAAPGKHPIGIVTAHPIAAPAAAPPAPPIRYCKPDLGFRSPPAPEVHLRSISFVSCSMPL